MAKKKVKEEKSGTIYACPCGSTSFIDEGMANYKDNVTISFRKGAMRVEGGDPQLDIISSTIKCAKCGAEV